eukprot:3552925-Pyramimonas_sp.AAC.1
MRGVGLAGSAYDENITVRTSHAHTGMAMGLYIIKWEVTVAWAIFVQGLAGPRFHTHCHTFHTLPKRSKVQPGMSKLGRSESVWPGWTHKFNFSEVSQGDDLRK